MKFLLIGILGFAIIVVDLMFIPGGVLIIFGSGLLGYSVYLNYQAYGLWTALLEIGIILAMLPSLIRYSLSRLGLKNEMRAEDGFVGVEDYSMHVGKEGRALTDLRPAGTILLQEEAGELRLDCIADGGYIEAGTPIRVTENRGPALVVRQVIEPSASPVESPRR